MDPASASGETNRPPVSLDGFTRGGTWTPRSYHVDTSLKSAFSGSLAAGKAHRRALSLPLRLTTLSTQRAFPATEQYATRSMSSRRVHAYRQEHL